MRRRIIGYLVLIIASILIAGAQFVRRHQGNFLSSAEQQSLHDALNDTKNPTQNTTATTAEKP